jgi:hypothetical protein
VHFNTILSQILKVVPRHEYEILANEHQRTYPFAKSRSGLNTLHYHWLS